MSRFLKGLLVGGLLTYVLALAVAFEEGTRNALAKADKVLDNSVRMMDESISGGADQILVFIGKTITKACRSPERMTAETLAHYQETFAVDEMTVVDRNGSVIVSTEPNLKPGADFNPSSNARTVDYALLLSRWRDYVVEDFRGSVERPDVVRKYAGIAFECGNGFIQIGIDQRRLASDFDWFYRSLASDWAFGESGYYILAHPATGNIISSCRPEDVGRNLNEANVAEGLQFTARNTGKTKRIRIFGAPSLVRDDFLHGHRVITVLPETEVTSARDESVAIIAVVLFAIFVAFGYLIRVIVDRNRQLQRFLEAEKSRVEGELLMAKAIQTNAMPSLFPPYPALADRIDLFASMRAAREVGGDFYDFYFTGANTLAIVIADVSGKGIPAAMFMMRAKASLQGLLRGGMDIEAAVAETNDRLVDGNEANMFVTAWIGIVNLVTGDLEYVNCGHNPPLVRRADGSVDWLRDKSGPPLAALRGVSYKRRTLALKLGDGLFLYTDGVTEANNPELELYGEHRLLDLVKGADGRDSRQVCADVILGVDGFAGTAEQADDITLLSFVLRGVEKSFPCNASGLVEANAYITRYFDDPKPSIVIDEIVSNIVRCSGAHSFSMKFVRDAKGTRMVFTDDGKPFDPTVEAPEPNLSGDIAIREVGGLGIFMVKKMSKAVKYAREGERNILTVEL